MLPKSKIATPPLFLHVIEPRPDMDRIIVSGFGTGPRPLRCALLARGGGSTRAPRAPLHPPQPHRAQPARIPLRPGQRVELRMPGARARACVCVWRGPCAWADTPYIPRCTLFTHISSMLCVCVCVCGGRGIGQSQYVGGLLLNASHVTTKAPSVQ